MNRFNFQRSARRLGVLCQRLAVSKRCRGRAQSKLQRHEHFLELEDGDLERLMAAIVRSQARDIHVFLLRCPEDVVEEYLTDMLVTELHAIACGYAEFDSLAQLHHVPDDLRDPTNPWISFLIETRIAEADPLIRRVISAFIAENLVAVRFAIVRKHRK